MRKKGTREQGMKFAVRNFLIRFGVSDRSTLRTTRCAPASDCPCQARSWGWEVSGVAAYLPRGPAHDTNPTDA